MPTTRARHAITETDPVAAAIDDAEKRWPEDAGNRAKLLMRLIDAGHRSISPELERQQEEHVAAIERTHGALRGVFGADYLRELRADWDD